MPAGLAFRCWSRPSQALVVPDPRLSDTTMAAG
jgi:hypothetical protein